MKFKSRFFLKDKLGQTRVRRKFLILPVCFGTKYWRWLEWADVVQQVEEVPCGDPLWNQRACRWVDIGFAGKAKDGNETA